MKTYYWACNTGCGKREKASHHEIIQHKTKYCYCGARMDLEEEKPEDLRSNKYPAINPEPEEEDRTA